MKLAGLSFLIFPFIITPGYSQSRFEQEERGVEVSISDPLIQALEIQDFDSVINDEEEFLSGSSGILFVGSKMTGVYLDLGLTEGELTEQDQFNEDDVMKLYLFHQMGHLNGCKSSVKPFIPTFRAGPFNGLLNIICGEHAKDHRQAGLYADVRNTFRYFSGNIIKMRRSAADDCPKANYGIVFFTQCKFLSQ